MESREMSSFYKMWRISWAFFSVTALFAFASALLIGLIFGLTHLLGWLGLPISGTEWVGVLAYIAIGLVMVMITATLLVVAERKWSARMQNRIGPNKARLTKRGRAYYGIPHLIADSVKMLFKEDFVPPEGVSMLFNLAPVMAMVPALVLAVILPIGPDLSAFGTEVRLQAARLDFGFLWLFAISSLAVYGTTLAGWSSNNKFSLLGALRASAQMISYEVTLGLTLVGAFLLYESLQPMGIVAWQDQISFGLPRWGVLYQPVALVFFMVAAFAEIKRAPFDLPESESEIIGYFTEYSGMKFGIFMISEFAEIVVLSGMIVVLFFGGWSIPWLPYSELHAWLSSGPLGADWGSLLSAFIAVFVFFTKMMFFVWIQMLIRWTLPRFRYDQVMDLGWKILLPLSLANVMITALVVIADPSLCTALCVGLFELVLFGGIVMSVSAPDRLDPLTPAAQNHASHG